MYHFSVPEVVRSMLNSRVKEMLKLHPSHMPVALSLLNLLTAEIHSSCISSSPPNLMFVRGGGGYRRVIGSGVSEPVLMVRAIARLGNYRRDVPRFCGCEVAGNRG